MDRPELQAYLAANMSVPCEHCTGIGGFVGDGAEFYNEECRPCQGAGKRYLLQRECPGTPDPEGVDEYWMCSGEEDCSKCHGLPYIYDDRADALYDAIEAKGWTWSVAIYDGGWSVEIYDKRTYSAPVYELDWTEGRRGTYAIETALYRAFVRWGIWRSISSLEKTDETH